MNEGMIFNCEKFKVMIHYIIDCCGFKDNFGEVLLNKILYFSDFDNYEIYEVSISNEKYIRKVNGPVSFHFNEALFQLVSEGKIKQSTETVINFKKYKYSSLTKPDTQLLSKNEILLIDDVINRISHFYSKEVIEYSHGDLPWKIAKDGGELNYEAVFYRDPEYSVREYDDDL